MQRSFDGPDTPLHQVTFCVVDLETTGATADSCAITEVAAARFRGGECLGTFQTLVDPGEPPTPAATALTGITAAMLVSAPPVAQVLPMLAEFTGGAVLVGHNVRFDVSFMDAALAATARPTVGLQRVDTLALARRLLPDEVDDCRLGTLARHLRLDHQPTHRALDDVLATADLLHVLLERAAAFGVETLDDLAMLPRLAGHPQGAKLRLTRSLPRRPGVYVLRDGQGRALRTGHAGDLRHEVRALFTGDEARTTGPLLRALHAVDHHLCPTPLAARVTALRLAEPPATGRGGRGGPGYVTLASGPSARLRAVRTLGTRPARRLGPLPTTAGARQVVDAVAAALASDGGDPPAAALTPAHLFDDPAAVARQVHRRMVTARRDGRHAWAASLRELGRALVEAVRDQRDLDRLRRVDRLVVEVPGEGGAEIRRGRLVRAWAGSGSPGDGPGMAALPAGVALPPAAGPLPPEQADELRTVAGWLDDNVGRLHLVLVEGELTTDLPSLPSFDEPDAPASGDAPAPAAGHAPRPDAAGLRCAAC